VESIRLHSLLWTILVLVMQGCAVGEIFDVPTKEELSQVEKSRIYPKNYDAVWAATIKSLATHGVSIQSQDKASGNISTDWVVEKEAIGVFTTGSRAKATILLEKQSPASTLVTVIPSFEIRVADEAHWQPTQRKRKHLDVERRFLDDIQNNL